MPPSSDSPRRVAITGIGVVSPIGSSLDALREALWAGQSGVKPLEWMAELPERVHYGGEAWGFAGKIDDFGDLPKERKKYIRKAIKLMCRETVMGLAAVEHAIQNAGGDEALGDPERFGVAFGSDYMLTMPEEFEDSMAKCRESGDFRYDDWGSAGLAEMNPLWMLKYLPNMPASHVAITYDLRGPNNSLTLREASGVAAVREAAQTIARGHADRMVAGATGTRLHPFKTVHAVQTEQLADPTLEPAEASRPFDSSRTGMVVGEGAGAVVLEELESARARGATIYGEVIGSGSSSVTDRELRGNPRQALENAAKAALRDAGVDAVGHVNANGLATPDADLQEAKAIAASTGREDTPVVAPKSRFGNLGAASGVVELACSLLALEKGSLFPAINCPTPDPECPVDASPAEGSDAGGSFLKLSVTPQGQAAAVVVRAV
ncbi:MAG: beta-ketoacyl-[acyl-carrier-protein] synthase family protein [Planctomycetota bacterium]